MIGVASSCAEYRPAGPRATGMRKAPEARVERSASHRPTAEATRAVAYPGCARDAMRDAFLAVRKAEK